MCIYRESRAIYIYIYKYICIYIYIHIYTYMHINFGRATTDLQKVNVTHGSL